MNLDDTLAALELLDQRKTFEKWRYFLPVPKQEEFLSAGEQFPERLLMAGNGNGKTEAGAYEISRHMAGEYPPWWKGYRFDKPVRVWAAGTSAKAVAEAAQTKLLGPPGNKELLGSGFIPRAAIIGDPRPSRGFPDAVESVQVRHVSGGISRLVMKTYQQQREDWQGADIDLIWFDEEPPPELYTEGRARLRGKGRTIMTFTPLKGMSDVVIRFMEEEDPDRVMIRMGIKDALWVTEEERRRTIAGFQPHEREARANGDPLLGSGKVFRTPLEDLLERPMPLGSVPAEWVKLWGVDFGGGSETAHPFAAVLLAWDREEVPLPAGAPPGPVGTIHLLHEIRMTNALIIQHAEAMRRIAGNVPVAWPPDGHVKERDSGESIAAIYRKYGLNMLETHATHVSGGISTYAGVADLDAYMQARQFKVGANLTMWQGEYGQYHYDEKNVLVKARDDLMSATRVAHIMRRRARAVPLGMPGPRPSARRGGTDFDLFTGQAFAQGL